MLAVRHSFFKHSSTSGLQCSGIVDQTNPDAEEREIVSRSLSDVCEDSGVRGGRVEASDSLLHGGAEVHKVGPSLSCDGYKGKINVKLGLTKSSDALLCLQLEIQ